MTGPWIQVDIIVPVHNASETMEETIGSAMHQVIPQHLVDVFKGYTLQICVCCYDDGSTDSSWAILSRLEEEYRKGAESGGTNQNAVIRCRLFIAKSKDDVGRGAGYARNRAAELSDELSSDHTQPNTFSTLPEEKFLCLLDSDDVMHETRVAEQCSALLALPKDERQRILLGCKMERDPPDSTWHYSRWANNLTDERLHLERFREVTLLQPTWFLCRSRFLELGGYLEAPKPVKGNDDETITIHSPEQQPIFSKDGNLCLIHPTFDTPATLRLAEDLRFFHAHLYADGKLRLHRSAINADMPLLTYRHRAGQSQSFQTSRKLLLHLRALAFEKCVLEPKNDAAIQKDGEQEGVWHKASKHKGLFVVWGAGRDGKDFVKALSEESRKRVYCFVDVDFKKIRQGFYVHRDLGLDIPIVHFSLLAKDPGTRLRLLEDKTTHGMIVKGKPNQSANSHQSVGEDTSPKHKKHKSGNYEEPIAISPKVAKSLDTSILPELPVVVCVAMYRSGGALESNVHNIGREEGVDLWHFS